MKNILHAEYHPIYIDDKSYRILKNIFDGKLDSTRYNLEIYREQDKIFLKLSEKRKIRRKTNIDKILSNIADTTCRDFIKLLIKHNLLSKVKLYLKDKIDSLNEYITEDAYYMIHRYRQQILNLKIDIKEGKPKKLIYIT